jgi:hypothetical protein
LPKQGDFIRRQSVRFVHEVAELAFKLQGFGSLVAGRFDGAAFLVTRLVFHFFQEQRDFVGRQVE